MPGKSAGNRNRHSHANRRRRARKMTEDETENNLLEMKEEIHQLLDEVQMKPLKLHKDEEKPENVLSISVQVFIPFIVAGLGMVCAGLVLDQVQVILYSGLLIFIPLLCPYLFNILFILYTCLTYFFPQSRNVYTCTWNVNHLINTYCSKEHINLNCISYWHRYKM